MIVMRVSVNRPTRRTTTNVARLTGCQTLVDDPSGDGEPAMVGESCGDAGCFPCASAPVVRKTPDPFQVTISTAL